MHRDLGLKVSLPPRLSQLSFSPLFYLLGIYHALFRHEKFPRKFRELEIISKQEPITITMGSCFEAKLQMGSSKIFIVSIELLSHFSFIGVVEGDFSLSCWTQ